MNLHTALIASFFCSTLLACGDDSQATGSGSASDSSTTEDPTPTSGDDPASTGGSSPTGGEGTTTSGGSATGGGDTTTAGDSSSGGEGPMAGVCAPTCKEAADCCPFGAVGCPSEDYPDNWSCEEGFCVFGGCSDDDDCTMLLDPAQQCHPISGVGTCFEPCRSDDDCTMLLGDDGECTGMADDGTMYCVAPVEPCRSDEDCGGNGTCDPATGACGCESDDECTEDATACDMGG